MKAVVVFREGQSGNFLRSVISNQPAAVASLRINDSLRDSFNDIQVLLTHDPDDLPESDCLLRILPTHNIYNACYNVFIKKILVEQFSESDMKNWTDNLTFWYDKCYYNIREYYFKIHKDIASNTIHNTIDFDRLTDLAYLADILHVHFGLELNNNQRALAEKYAKLQLPIALTDDDTQLMQDILEPITDQMLLQNPWFWAYAVFKFEHNNNLTEQDRLWSVNDFKVPQTRNDLTQYQFLKQTKSNK
jgi:hypothetical protein